MVTLVTKLLSIIVIIGSTTLLTGCVTYNECINYPQGSLEYNNCADEVRAWRRGIDAENWDMCVLAYKNSGIPTIHYNHSHNGRSLMSEPSKREAIRSDLIHNHCRTNLKDWWIEY